MSSLVSSCYSEIQPAIEQFHLTAAIGNSLASFGFGARVICRKGMALRRGTTRNNVKLISLDKKYHKVM
jgi:hypothetical protein